MRKMELHPERNDLLKAAKTGKVPFQTHLETCLGCHELFEFFKLYQVDRNESPLHLSDDILAKFTAIPLLVESRNASQKIQGSVIYDSWTNIPAQQLRDSGKNYERHLRLKASDIILEIVTEKQIDCWDFTARVYRNKVVTTDFILKVGRKKIVALAQKCFFGSSKNPPNKVKLLSNEMIIDFGSLQWKNSGTK